MQSITPVLAVALLAVALPPRSNPYGVPSTRTSSIVMSPDQLLPVTPR